MTTQLLTLLNDLVAIDSVNPDLVPGAAGEAEIAGFVARWLEDAGLEVHLDEVSPNRPNAIAVARGSGGGKTLLLNGHMDTVGVAGMTKPLQPEVRQNLLYGRGAYDMKGGLAACMIAIAEAKKLNLAGDVILSAVIDEEYAGLGSLHVADHYRADGAIVAEATHLQLIVAHKGFVWLEVETTGVAAHGSRPELGVDAIVKTGPILTGLESLQRDLQSRPSHPRLNHASIHASMIQGGREWSTYPERCVLSIERRTLPGETPESVQAELEEIIVRQQAVDPKLRAMVRTGLCRAPLETPEDAAIVLAVKAAGERVLQRPLELTGVPYWTDAASLWGAGIPSVLFGPSGGGAHAAEEWVELESVQECADIYLKTIKRFCA